MKQFTMKMLFHPHSLTPTKVRTSLSLLGAVTLIILSISFSPKPILAGAKIKCANKCSEFCDPGLPNKCWQVACCDEADLPCTEDDTFKVTCYGDPDGGLNSWNGN